MASREEWGLSRRSFVRATATAGAGFSIVPAHVLGRTGRPPSDTLNVAHIGVGGMGGADVAGMADVGENIYALCDVDENQAARSWGAHPSAKRYRDFRVMLEEDGANIDAVVISTPDHTHAVAGLMALSMGKPTRIQKPLARTIGEVRALTAAAAEAGVATQMGNQGHAMEGTRRMREWYEAGAIGTIERVEYWTNRPIWPQAIHRPTEAHHAPPWLDWDLWLGPVADRPYHPAYAPFNWRGWWDFGTGALGDIACHAMDAAFWTFGLGRPARVTAESTTLFPETAPAASRIEYDFPAREDRPPIRAVWRDGNLSPPRPDEVADDARWPADSSGQLWIGSDGKMLAGIYGENPRLLDPERDADLRANPPAETYPRTDGVYAEFAEACKGGTPAGSSFVEHAGPLTEMALLGNLAVRSGRAIELDPESGAIVNGGRIPTEYVDPPIRSGWTA
ncbi:MAG: Gfo/Idh/MocA family oxidoreductase [Gemmatimonadetes bacterium]|nr:Gfo/Idh/MocA family oxidoreductase [Gemmatimonadota bacterium]